MESIVREMHTWMHDYMRSFYTSDTVVQEGILLKEEHTGYVTSIAIELAKHLGLSRQEIHIAELIGLLHDVGRFRQYATYKTFNDAESEDHANLGLKVLYDACPLYEKLPVDVREKVDFAITRHNKKEIGKTSDREQLLFAKLIRDADKLDIYRVLRPFLTAPTGESVSADFVSCFVRGEQVDYTKIRTQEDRKLVRLMWVYDINFSWTLRRMVERGYVKDILENLQETEEIAKGVEQLKSYIERKCKEVDTIP